MTRDWRQRRAFLFSHPRTCSNLLTRILSNQPEWTVSDYLFFDAFQYTRDAFADVAFEQVPNLAREKHQDLVNKGFQSLEDALKVSQQHQRHLFLKDHAHLTLPVEITYGDLEPNQQPRESSWTNSCLGSSSGGKDPHSTSLNPTIFSDDFMLSLTPIILIRNPILIYESWLQAEGEPYPDLTSQYARIYTTLSFQRRIFDWFDEQKTKHGGPKCLVLDADDVISGPEVPQALCDAIGMDETKLLWAWETSPIPQKFQGNERFRRFVRTISESTGIEVSKSSKGVLLSDRKKEWKEKFGAERASILAKRVEDSWDDYEYLKARKL